MEQNKPEIYFAGSIRAGRQDASTYEQLVLHLKRRGTVLTEHVGIDKLLNSQVKLTDAQIYEQDMNWLDRSDCIVAEISRVSMGVGFELGRAVAANKPVLCLFRQQPDGQAIHGQYLSAMISGCPKIKTVRYTELQEAKDAIDEFLTSL